MKASKDMKCEMPEPGDMAMSLRVGDFGRVFTCGDLAHGCQKCVFGLCTEPHKCIEISSSSDLRKSPSISGLWCQARKALMKITPDDDIKAEPKDHEVEA